ncbi:hypothetical protein [Chryseobacterium shigense]|uniref:Head domain of trimeric autotransporter adhesin n=1 Tax=Chryseobacterium shigense TaxID=297244 RepID=A0A841N5N9_9FLAO|nr:hypothetical protein [Chryseobacterium shigense]MBB6372174.1 hypothetical protein [Chryseobacterium shigense]
MKSKLLTIAAISFTGYLMNAQVGFNTNQPQATMDVVGFPTVTTKPDGIIAPRLTLSQLAAKTYAAAQTGALVYVTTINATPAGVTINVNTAGYYYFDGTLWQKQTGTEWKLKGNADNEISTAVAQTLGSAPDANNNYLGTQGATDDLIIVTANKTHGILNSTGTLAGGGETTSGLSWGNTNTFNTAPGANANNSILLGAGNNATGSYNTVAIGQSNIVSNPRTGNLFANYAIGSDNQIAGTAGGGANFTFGKGNRVTTGAVLAANFLMGTNNTSTISSALIFGDGNTVSAVGASQPMIFGAGNSMIGPSNQSLGNLIFGSGLTTDATGGNVNNNALFGAGFVSNHSNNVYLGVTSPGGSGVMGSRQVNTSNYQNSNHLFVGNNNTTVKQGTKVFFGGTYTPETGAANWSVMKYPEMVNVEGAITLGDSLGAVLTTNNNSNYPQDCGANNQGTIRYRVNSTGKGNIEGCVKNSASPVSYRWEVLNNSAAITN